jgi:hypothetical protein
LAAILSQQPTATGILGDLPHVVSLARPVLQQAGVVDRCRVAGCDFFETVPSGGDIYILKHVIHDCDDERARTILKNCYRSIAASARLLIIDMVLPAQPSPEGAIAYTVDMTYVGVDSRRSRTNRRRVSELA